jgi:hypothetical protein
MFLWRNYQDNDNGPADDEDHARSLGTSGTALTGLPQVCAADLSLQ